MNLAYVAWKLNADAGSITMAREVLTGILAAGVPVNVFSYDRCEPPHEAGDSAYSRLTCYSLPRRSEFPRQFNRRAARRLLDWVASKTIDLAKRRQLLRSSRELLVVNGLGSDFVWDFFNGSQPLKSVLVVHDNPVRHRLPGESSLDLALELMQKYSHFIFVSSRVRDEWLAIPSIAAKESCAIPNCCREEAVERVLALDRAEVRHRLGLAPEAFVVVCVASIQYLKGQDLLVACFPRIISRAPSASLVLVGAPGGMPAGLAWGQTFLKELGTTPLKGRITAVGARSDALEFIYAADAFVLPSRCEAMPVTILEAMALGTPVVASDVGGIPELIEHGRSGLLFRSEDAQGLEDSLVQLACSSEFRQELAANARSRYWSSFSRKHLVSRYADAIGKLVLGEPWDGTELSWCHPERELLQADALYTRKGT
jgi:glycosyltransferase involved in cell wall biosynthesis